MPKKLTLLFSLIFIFVLVWSLQEAPYFWGSDDIRVIRLFNLDKCLQDGQIPCRWISNTQGMGYPLFNFLAPLPYYFSELIYFISHSFNFAIKMAIVTALCGAFLFAYTLVRRFWTALFYTLILVTLMLYFKGVLGQLWLLMFLPALFWSALRLKKTIKIINILLVTLLITLFILSDALGIIILLSASVLLIGSLLYQKKWRLVSSFSLAFLIGLLLSTFYWLPMLAERKFAVTESVANVLPATKLSLSRYEIIAGDTAISNYHEASNKISFQADTQSHTIIRLSDYYFPNWELTIDGALTKMDYENSLGLMTFILGKGTHNVELKLHDTPLRRVANFLTIAGVIAFLLLVLMQFVKIRQWFLYYVKSMNR